MQRDVSGPRNPNLGNTLASQKALKIFALMFATDKVLAVNDEFVVIEKAGADSEIEFFKVSRASPYALMPGQTRASRAHRHRQTGAGHRWQALMQTPPCSMRTASAKCERADVWQRTCCSEKPASPCNLVFRWIDLFSPMDCLTPGSGRRSRQTRQVCRFCNFFLTQKYVTLN